jgi:hypothetical protein
MSVLTANARAGVTEEGGVCGADAVYSILPRGERRASDGGQRCRGGQVSGARGMV